MSDSVDLRLLGKMVSRLQSTVDDVRHEYAGLRASLDALNTTVVARFSEFNVRMSSLELAQMKLAASIDDAHTKIDRVKVDLEDLRAEVHGLRTEMAANFALILSRLPER